MSTEQSAVSTPGTKRRQQQRSVVTQQKLLDAAIQAFSENGFKGTSTRDIADRAGVHHPLITYHFKNKNRLWRAAADKVFRDFNISLVKAMAEVPDVDPRARAETFIRTYVRYASLQPALHKMILQESSYPSERLDWLVENHLRPLYDLVEPPLKQLQELGIAPSGSTGLLYNMIRVSAGGLLALVLEIRGTTDIDLELDEELDELADMIVRVFLRDRPARSA